MDATPTPETTAPSATDRVHELGLLGFSASEAGALLGMGPGDFVSVLDGTLWKAFLAGRTEGQLELRRNLLAKARAGRIGPARALLAFHDRGDVDLELVHGQLRPFGATEELQERQQKRRKR